MTYESPIKVFQQQLEMQLEGDIMKAVQRHHIEVDKEELLKALKYDRDQYMKGYEEGRASAFDVERTAEELIEALKKQTPKKPLYIGLDNACRECETYIFEKDKYCPRCGQAIDWGE
jgi:hypothetical protein